MIVRLAGLGFVLVLASASVDCATAQVAGPLAPAETVAAPTPTKLEPVKTKPAKTKPTASAKPVPGKSATERKRAPARSPLAREPLDGTPAAPRAITHAKQVDDPLSVGMSWSGSNTPNYGSSTTSGLMNAYNHNLGAPSVGTGAEVGVKLKF